MSVERCGLCGAVIDVGDADVVQIHGGSGGLVHEECLQEHETNEQPKGENTNE
jgi:hypothetical protein